MQTVKSSIKSSRQLLTFNYAQKEGGDGGSERDDEEEEDRESVRKAKNFVEKLNNKDKKTSTLLLTN